MSLILSGTDGLSDVDGTAATPAIRGTDANTGIFFPAADTIGFSEGGVEAARINSSGQFDLVNNPVLTGGTANGVAYLNGSKVLTTGSALVFDGTNFGVGVTPSAGWNTSNNRAIQLLGGYASLSANNSQGTCDLAYNCYNSTTQAVLGWKYTNSSAAATLYQQLNGAHAWYTAPSGTAGNAITFTQAMTLDASGRLGIGTTTMSTSENLVVSNGTVDLVMSPGAFSSGNVGMIGTKTNHGLSFAINTAQKMAIDTSGNLLVGTTSATQSSGGTTYTCKQVIYVGNQAGIYSRVSTTGAANVINNEYGSGTRYLLSFDCGATRVGDITSNGTVTVYGGTSDYRLKTVIGSVTGHGERIDALEPIEYTWNLNGLHTRGFLAHKFQEIYADSVIGIKDAVDANGSPVYQSMQAATSEVIADLVAEIQSLRKRLAALESA